VIIKTKSKQQGFTIVEMSVVIVLIGLLIGALMKGKEMIRATKVRATISELTNVKKAALRFRQKYGTMPGDFNRATTELVNCIEASTSCYSGDNNGKVEPPVGAGAVDEEEQFWKHLFYGGYRQNEIFDSQIVGGTARVYYDEYPSGSLTPGYMGGTGKHWLIFESAAALGVGCCLSLSEQRTIDMKIDDGDFVGASYEGAETGAIRFFDPLAIPAPDASAPQMASGLDSNDGSLGMAIE
jgi:prepilin-type N-terminal cleavage/methylation domain-containing protein